MNFLDSPISKYLFNEHPDNTSIVGGMPLIELLGNSTFVGGSIDRQIANLENTRFKNLVVPVGFYVDRSNNEYITPSNISNENWRNEDTFEELFGISIRNHINKTRSNRNPKSTIKSKKKR